MDEKLPPKTTARYIVREIMGLATMGAALFWSAGTLLWWQGWAALLAMAFWVIATAYVILKHHPALLAERLGPKKGSSKADLAIMSLLGVIQLGKYIIAGLDLRYSWTQNFPEIIQYLAVPVCFFAQFMTVWATRTNAFFSQIIRVQKERNQTVISSGPYQIVRHPGYLGSVLFEVFVALLLGSLWALIPAAVNAGLLILRTGLEDRILQSDLQGYKEYTQKIRYRLLPFIW